MTESPFKNPKGNLFRDLVTTFAFPMLIGKSLILFFGLMYSAFPGEGYGTGLVISLIFTVVMAGRFVWKHRHYEDV